MHRFLQRYTGFLRNIRILHYLYNFLHQKGLKHNQHLYPFFGINKSIYSSISHKDFIGKKAKAPWLDAIVSEKDIQNHPEFGCFPTNIEAQLMQWKKNGFIIWENFLDTETVDIINEEIDTLLEKNSVGFNYTNTKIFNAYKHAFSIRKVMKDKRLLQLFSFILNRKVIPFQSINFLKGSEQRAHSDAIHMTTFPQGNLLAAWFALEDINIDQGPLSYYIGSHTLPYITNADYGNSANKWMLDGEANEKYEKKIAQIIQEQHLQKKVITIKKGDVFIWHANLLHGGEPQLNKDLTRKSMVVHYFASDVIAYHEISERPAIFDVELVGEIEDDFYKGQTHLL